VEAIAPLLALLALAVLIACGGGWRKTAWWLAGGAVLVFVVAFAAGYVIDRTSGTCERDICPEHFPFFIGLFLEVMLGGVAVLLAIIAALARLLRA
jgi:hypothetical protein